MLYHPCGEHCRKLEKDELLLTDQGRSAVSRSCGIPFQGVGERDADRGFNRDVRGCRCMGPPKKAITLNAQRNGVIRRIAGLEGLRFVELGVCIKLSSPGLQLRDSRTAGG